MPEYRVINRIYESRNSQIYRGIRGEDNLPVVLKLLATETPTAQVVGRYKLEYEIIKSIDSELVIKAYDFRQDKNQFAIILEDFGGQSLDYILKAEALDLSATLNLAIQICEAVGAVHAANIIHKDINPSNLVFNPETRQIKIIDFGISSSLPREKLSIDYIEGLEGTLAYISPEQTGRMNRSLDYRTDIYSMGATFYEMFTGCVPFKNDDPLELIHQHLALAPIAPHLTKSSIPEVISQIILKLLAKNAEDRYQSVWGVKADLEECLNQWRSQGKIESLPLATQDITDKFLIPEKLYGREQEVARLLDAFEKVASQEQAPESQGIEIVLLSGYSGMGKSRLAQEIRKLTARSRGYFIAGKFDQYQRNIPYYAIAQAFEDLIAQLLMESEASLQQWRSLLLQNLGSNKSLITQVIPSLELIIGKQDSDHLENIFTNEAQNRFNLVFQKFIRVFARSTHPLTIFLDDLQWAERASLKLLELVATSPQESILLVGAYRDNEVNAAHPMQQMLKNIQQLSNIKINQLDLTELSQSDISQLISDTLSCSLTESLPLAELVQQKTGGNPFFINEFLKSLWNEGLISFNYQSHRWQWSISQIRDRDITDNVVSLMITKIKKLSDRTQQLLQIAACIGNRFDTHILLLVNDGDSASSQRSLNERLLPLTEATCEGLILPLNNAHQSIFYGSELTDELPQISYKFVHDRIQQAAYSLIPTSQQPRIHQRIGQQLLANTKQPLALGFELTINPELELKVFDIVAQLNLGIELIIDQELDQESRFNLAQLNLIASQKAKKSSAFSASLNYAKTGLSLLSSSSWHTHYDLTLSLHHLAIESAFLSGDYSQMQDWANLTIQNAKNLLDQVKVYEIQIQSLVAQDRRIEAIAIGISTLNLLEISLPAKVSPSDIGSALQDFQEIISTYSPKDLLDLPAMTAPQQLASVNILLSIAAAAYVAAPDLYIIVVLALIKLSIKHGNAQGSSYGYAACGLILCGLLNQMELGFQFGQLALNLVNRLSSQELLTKVVVIVNVFVNHWTSHLKETLQPLLNAYAIGMETGDIEFAAYSLCLHCHHLYFSGCELNQVENQICEHRKLIVQLKQETTLNWLNIYHQSILNLLDKSPCPEKLVGEVYNSELMSAIHLQNGDRSSLFMLHFQQMSLSYLFEKYDQAISNCEQAHLYKESATGLNSYAIFCFYETLSRLAIYPNLDSDEQLQAMAAISDSQQKMHIWAIHAPTNYLHKWQLITAEKYRVLGQVVEAMEAYDLAIEYARQNQYIQEEALANELAAKFYLSLSRHTIARTYIQEARYCYLQWGAVAKVKHLEDRYKDLFNLSLHNYQSSDYQSTVNHSRSLSSNSSLNPIDFESVIRSSQAIASELDLDKLLTTLMNILIESAGAQTGYLLLPKSSNFGDFGDQPNQMDWQIEAIKDIKHENVAFPSLPLCSNAGEDIVYGPLSLINYVARTRETIVLDNASQSSNFQNDPWIVQNQSKSLLCMPLINQSNLIAIILLENDLIVGAFTPERIEILNLLSTQAAISILKGRLLQQQSELNISLQSEINDRLLAEKERDRLITILQASTDIIGMSSPQGNVLWNNAQANKLRGVLSETDITELSIANYHPQWALDIVQSQGIPTAIAAGTWVGETAILNNEGQEIPVSQMIIAHKDINGDLEYISTIMRDITEAKERESALSRSEKTLQSIVAGTAAVTGIDFFPALVKHIAEALDVEYSLVTKLVDGKLYSLAFWGNGNLQEPMSYYPAKAPCEIALRDGEYICPIAVQQLFPEDEDLLTMEAVGYMGLALKNSEGQAIGNLCILDKKALKNIPHFRNIMQVFAARASTELQRMADTQKIYQLNHFLEERVKERTAQLETANQELESFSYSVSHDLRAPLRAIDGFSRILQEDHGAYLDSEAKRYLKIIRDNTKRMGELIDDLLNLSRWNRREMSVRQIDVNSLVKKVLDEYRAEIERRQIELIVSELPECQADDSLLTQVWVNLISNAVKYTSKTEQARIEISYQIINDEVIYFIGDNGSGFDMQYADKLFGVFQRMHLERDFEGTGIGLAIAQRIIQRHGGRIWANAAVNQGATFYFTLNAYS
ncbi:MAG: hypothetical protein DCE90_05445 [Pseudanabaena sp.]|nr:MAG: hypothetical protein DCE90_05445 [Pseudanabaena sp.]